MSINTTFKALWAQLETIVPARHHVAAKALLAIAYDYRQERDEPPSKFAVRPERQNVPPYEPRPETIQEEIANIQSEWSDEEFYERARKSPDCGQVVKRKNMDRQLTQKIRRLERGTGSNS